MCFHISKIPNLIKFHFFFLDLPVTNDDDSDFGDDDFLHRNNSLALDEQYWDTELTEKLIKVRLYALNQIGVTNTNLKILHTISARGRGFRDDN